MATADEGGREPPEGWCPRCLSRFPITTERCPSCQLSQVGPDVNRLRQVVSRLAEVEREQWKLATEATGLREERTRLLQAMGAGPAPAPAPRSAITTKPAEWRAETIRDVLLILGSVLLALAALTFSVIAWRRFGDSGRAGILLLATLGAALGTVGTRRRLPVTAEALSAITVALFLVDWYALRRAGLAVDLSGATWWALGTALAAGACAAVGPWLRAPVVGAAVLGQVSAWLVVLEALDSSPGRGIALAVIAAAAALGAGFLTSRREWLPAAIVLGAGGLAAELGALGFAFESGSIDAWGEAARAAIVLATMAVAPGVGRATVRMEVLPRLWPDGLVALSTACLLAAGATLLSARWQGDGLLAAVAVLGAAAAGATSAMPRPLARGSAAAAGVAVGLGVLGLLEPVVEAVVQPLAWLSRPWSGDLAAEAARNLTPEGSEFDAGWAPIVALGAAVATLLAAATVVPRRIGLIAAGGTAAAALAVLPLAAGLPVGGAEAVTAIAAVTGLALSVLADRRDEHLVANGFLAVAGTMAATSLGWGLATEAGTLAVLAIVAGTGGVAASVVGHPVRRMGLMAVGGTAVIAEAGAVTRSAGGAVEHTGFVVLITAGVGLVAAVHIPEHRLFAGRTVEVLALAGTAAGLLLAAADGWWLAAALTLSVAVFAAAAVRARPYLWAAAGASVAATWAWLAEADVGLLEAYTLPAAAVAVGCGLLMRRTTRAASSWLTLGPGLAVATGPTLGLALTERGAARPLLLSAGALAMVMLGARTRLQAPLVIGAVVLLLLAIDTLAPVAAQLPRWLVIGAAGVVLLWLGATAERRLIQLRTLSRRFQEMENPVPQ